MAESAVVAARPRDLAFDVLKGIGIAEVLTHHTLSFSARKFAVAGSAEAWLLWGLNRLLHFAIPMFLLCSALLLARSLAKRHRPDYRHYAKRRLIRTVGPYLIWSVLFLLYRAYFMGIGSDTQPYTLNLPWIGAVTGPDVLFDPIELRHNVVWGKAWFHLYFLSVLIQLTLLLPLLVAILKRTRIGFGAMALVAGVIQVGCYLLQAHVIRSPHPASLFTWYMPAILLGTWLGIHWAEWPAIWQRNRRWFLVGAAVAVTPYLVQATWNRLGHPISTLALNCSLSLYTASMALTLLGLASAWRPTRPVLLLAWLGSLSLPIFILHPIILSKLGGPRITALLDAIPGSPLATLMLVAVLTIAAAKVLIGLRLDGILFGRRYSQEPKVEVRPAPTAAQAEPAAL